MAVEQVSEQDLAVLDALMCNLLGLHKPSVAEELLDVARILKYPRDLLLIPTPYCVENMHRVRLALDLDRRHRGLILRAIVENWDLPTLIREMY